MKNLLIILILLLLHSFELLGQKTAQEPLIYVSKGEMEGYITFEGKEIVPVEFSKVGYFEENKIRVAKGGEMNFLMRLTGGTWGFWSRTGKEVIPLTYEATKEFQEGLAAVRLDGKWGFVNENNTLQVPLTYERVNAFSEGLAAVRLNGKWGFINKNNTLQIPLVYDEVYSFEKGLATVRVNRKWGVMDQKGNWVIPPSFGFIGSFKDGVARVAALAKGYDHIYDNQDDEEDMNYEVAYENYGLVNKEGLLVLDTIYDHIDYFEEGFASIEKGDKEGIVNTKGKIIVPIKFDYIKSFSEGLVAVANYQTRPSPYDFGYSQEQVDSLKKESRKRSMGFDRDKEKEALARQAYQKAALQEPSRRLTYGYLNTKGAIIIPFQFDAAEDFKNGLAKVAIGKESLSYIIKEEKERIAFQEQINVGFNLVDKTGILQFNKNKVTIDRWNNTIQTLDSKGAGAYTEQMVEIVPPQYKQLTYLGEGYYCVEIKKTKQKKIIGNGLDLLLNKNIVTVEIGYKNKFLVRCIVEEKDTQEVTKMGIINDKGAWVVEPIYDEAYIR